MTAKVARNAPCPCGSGRKYKRCCGDGQTAAPVLSNRLTTIVLSVCVIAAVGLLVSAVMLTRPDIRPTGARSAVGDSSETHEPWYYDAANDRYWHIEGNGTPGHWHDGPPPVQPPATAGEIHQPFEYDAANDRYWHVEREGAPGHWHPGRPPTMPPR